LVDSGVACLVDKEKSEELGVPMSTTFLKRQKEMKRQEKQRKKAELRR
jgi:hypothetical protein